MNFIKIFILCIFSLSLLNCSTNKARIDTDPDSIYINAPYNLTSCRFLGVVETRDLDNWEDDLKRAASRIGATHIQSPGPNYVGFDEIVSGHSYRCD